MFHCLNEVVILYWFLPKNGPVALFYFCHLVYMILLGEINFIGIVASLLEEGEVKCKVKKRLAVDLSCFILT